MRRVSAFLSGVTLVCGVASPGFAFDLPQGGGTGVDGGDIVRLPDSGKIVLADPYIIRVGEKDLGDLDPAILAEIDRAGRLLVRLGAAVAEPSRPANFPKPPGAPNTRILTRSGPAKFVVENVLDRKIEYRFVPSLAHCNPGNDVGDVPGGGTIEHVACTQRMVTWIRKDIFRDPRMSVREQAKLIIHERLHALSPDSPHEFIADVTTGLELLLSLNVDQALGNRRALQDSEVEIIRTLVKRIDQLGLSQGRPEPDLEFWDNYHVAKNGGGLVHNQAQVDPKAYVGAGSLLSADVSMDATSEMVNSSCYLATCQIGPGAKLIESSIEPGFGDNYSITPLRVKLGKNTRLKTTRLAGAVFPLNSESAVMLDEGSMIVGSTISGVQKLSLGWNSGISDTAVTLSTGANNLLNLDLGYQASIEHLVVPMIFAKAESKPELVLAVPPQTGIQFKDMLCPSGQFVVLQDDLNLDSAASIQGRCADRLPLPR